MKNIRNLVGTTWGLLKWDWSSLLLFEVIYKMLFLVIISLSQNGLDYALDGAGITYLTNQNVFQLFRHPLSLLLIFLLFLLVMYVSFVETTAIVLYCQQGIRGERVGVRRLFTVSLKRAFSIFKAKNLWMLIMVLLSMPLTGITFMSGPVSSLKIPGFILESIHGNRVLSLVYGAGILMLSYMLYRWIFSIHEFILNRCSFKEARERSSRLLEGRKIKILFFMLGAIALLWAAVLFICGAIIMGMLLFFRLTSEPGEAAYAFWHYYNDMKRVGSLLFSMLKPVLLLGLVTAVYYHVQGYQVSIQRPRKKAARKLLMLAECAAVFVLATFYIELTMPYDYTFWENKGIQVVAHRAGAMFGPENTLAALSDAIKSGADAAEIDVQQTKDGELVVMHDTNFKRICGISRNIWDVTLAEAKTYDMGSFFSPHYRDERIPTLEEMMKAADNRISLMIELKSSGHERGLEEKTVALIHEYGFSEQCTIASMDYRILQKIKELDPGLKTVYIAALAYGDMAELQDADMISVEETFANRQLLRMAEFYGKKVYVWTLNQKSPIKKMIQLQVDGIITDNVYFTDYLLEEGGRSTIVGEMAEKLLAEPEPEK